MKRPTFMLLSVVSILAGFVLMFSAPVYASSAHAAHEEEVTEKTHDAPRPGWPGEVPAEKPLEEVVAELAPMNEMDLYPCSDCHDEDWEPWRERRELEEPHNEIPGKFVNHDSENRWCLDCHSANNRDRLRLINGELVKFNEYYKVCAQCHRRVFREWKSGVHGKRTGNWNGKKEHWHCTQCHDPHNPPFKAITPMPAPREPLEVWQRAEDSQTSSESSH